MVGQQRQQISELQFDKFPWSTIIFGLEKRFKSQVTTCSDVPSDAKLWIKEVEMVDSSEELKSPRSVYGEEFPNFKMLDAKTASALNQIIQNSHFKKKVSLEEQKAQKEGRFPRGRQITFMIYDHFRVTGAHDTVLDYADLFSITFRDVNIQEFDTRWDAVLLSMSKIPSDDVLESLYKLRIREFDQLKTVLELYDMEIHQKISMPNSQKNEDNGEKEYISETTITKLWRQARENWNRSSGQESKRTHRRWRRKRYLVPVEGKRPMFGVKPVQFPAWEWRSCTKKRHQMPPHFLGHQWHEVEVCRGKEVSISFFDNRADTMWKVLARVRFVNIASSRMSILQNRNGM